MISHQINWRQGPATDASAIAEDGARLVCAITRTGADGRDWILVEIVNVNVAEDGDEPIARLENLYGEPADFEWSEVEWYLPENELVPASISPEEGSGDRA